MMGVYGKRSFCQITKQRPQTRFSNIFLRSTLTNIYKKAFIANVWCDFQNNLKISILGSVKLLIKNPSASYRCRAHDRNVSSTRPERVEHTTKTCRAHDQNVSSTRPKRVERTTKTCRAHEQHMSSARTTHVERTNNTCRAHEQHMPSARTTHAERTNNTCRAHDQHMPSTRSTHVEHTNNNKCLAHGQLMSST